MGKGVPLPVKQANAKMPFRAKEHGKTKPTTWKQKQKVCANAGLRAMSAPWVIYALCSLLFSRGDLPFKPVDHVELFAGDMAITKGEWKEGRSNAIPMDIRFGPDQDILSNAGFCNALYQVLSLRPGSGALWAAPVCSTWVFMSRGSTKRSKTHPMGCCTGVTQEHNVMVARVVLLLCIAAAKGCWWMMEQPKGSLLEDHVAFQVFLRMLQKLNASVSRCSTSLCWFGADTRKPLWIYSSEDYVEHVNSYADTSAKPANTSEMVVKYTDSKGVKRIKGGADLKRSQSYPPRFGLAVAKVQTRFLKVHKKKAQKFLLESLKTSNAFSFGSKCNRFWVDQANLKPILSFLANRP